MIEKAPKVELENVNLRFRIYSNKSPNLKEMAVNLADKTRHLPSKIDFFALRDFSMSAQAGERIGIMGLNGAGKSTILKTIAGIYPPQSGTVRVSGKLTPLIELGTGFDLDLSGRENIYLNGTMLKYDQSTLRELEEKIIDFAAIGDFIDLPIKYYSSGMVSRLALSIAFMVPSEIILLDEILATGDRLFVEKATAHFSELLKRPNIIFFVSHDLEKLMEICNRVLVIHQGELKFDGEPEEAIEFYEKEIVRVNSNFSGSDASEGEANSDLTKNAIKNRIGAFSVDQTEDPIKGSESKASDFKIPGFLKKMLPYSTDMLAHFFDETIAEFVGWEKNKPEPGSLCEEKRRIYDFAFPLWQQGKYTEAIMATQSIKEKESALISCEKEVEASEFLRTQVKTGVE